MIYGFEFRVSRLGINPASRSELMNKDGIPDRIDTPPEHARLMEGIKPVFAPTEVLEEFERYAKMFHEIYGGR